MACCALWLTVRRLGQPHRCCIIHYHPTGIGSDRQDSHYSIRSDPTIVGSSPRWNLSSTPAHHLALHSAHTQGTSHVQRQEHRYALPTECAYTLNTLPHSFLYCLQRWQWTGERGRGGAEEAEPPEAYEALHCLITHAIDSLRLHSRCCASASAQQPLPLLESRSHNPTCCSSGRVATRRLPFHIQFRFRPASALPIPMRFDYDGTSQQ